MLERINDNAYKLDLPGEYNVSATFNVNDLSPFDVGDDLRTNPFQEEGNDANQSTTPKDPIQVPIGPVTRSRAKKFKEVLNGLIQQVCEEANMLGPVMSHNQAQGNLIIMLEAQEDSLSTSKPKGI